MERNRERHQRRWINDREHEKDPDHVDAHEDVDADGGEAANQQGHVHPR